MMGPVGWLIRARVRSRGVALALLALVAALGATAALAAIGDGARTASAYSRYLARAHVGDVVINPSLVGRDIDRVTRDLPGVTSVTSSVLLDATVDEGTPRTHAVHEADPDPVEVDGSLDGRFTTMDRPALVRGRMPTGPDEALVNVEQAADSGWHLGTVIPIALWSRSDVIDDPATIQRPLAVERVRIVGIATLSDEVLPDGVYPRHRIILSPEFTARYACLPASPSPNATLEDAVAILAPKSCATSYQYYSLDIRGGEQGISAALAVFTEQSGRLTAKLPKALRETGAEYTLVAKTATRDEEDRVARSNSPLTAALVVLGLAAAAITIATVGLMVAREIGRARSEQVGWWQLGLSRSQRALAIAAPMFISVAVGVVTAVLLAWLVSPIAPIGTVRSIDPHPGHEVSGWVFVGAVALMLALWVLIAALALRSSRRVALARLRVRPTVLQRLSRRLNRPDVREGLRAAYSTNLGAALIVALAGSAVAVLLAAVVFGNSLSKLTSTPSSYGWPWDVAALRNAGYSEPDLDAAAITAAVGGRRDVVRTTVLGFSNAIKLDGEAIPAVFSFDRESRVDITMVEGRLPTAADEVAVGARTAADHGLGLGDHVTVSGPEIGTLRATISGVVVLPSLGPLLADRVAPGRGLLLPEAALPTPVARTAATFVGMSIAKSADARAVLARVGKSLGAGRSSNHSVTLLSKPVRPPEIINARSARVTPLLVGGLLVVAATIGLAVGIIASVRARRRELAILRALGFTGRQLRTSVRVQALATTFGGVVVGIPLGIIIGRVAWRAFASELGVGTASTTPVLWIVATGVGAAVVALLAASRPARVAAGTKPTAPLRSE
jgi:hypothetical protein